MADSSAVSLVGNPSNETASSMLGGKYKQNLIIAVHVCGRDYMLLSWYHSVTLLLLLLSNDAWV